MKKIEAKPYHLFNSIQYYDWGTKNELAFIPNWLGITAEKDKPYAELWIGAHPKCSSDILLGNEKIALNLVIENQPEAVLGKEVYQRFGAQLPFLLKVLSAARALSIQLHPNKQQAAILHQRDPKNYPDNNHKPEIAISLDFLTALAGFLPIEEIRKNTHRHPEILQFDLKNKLENEPDFQHLYTEIMKSAEDQEKIKVILEPILKRIAKSKDLTKSERELIKQFEMYGWDIGLFSFFFFNLIELKPGQAIFTGAGIPHAYLGGNIIECMANSDNVVRAGLTPKFKDVSTLLDIIIFNFEKLTVINENLKEDCVTYLTTAPEFEVQKFTKKNHSKIKFETHRRPMIWVVVQGQISVIWNGQNQTFKKGESFLIPAVLNEFEILTSEPSTYFLVQIPN